MSQPNPAAELASMEEDLENKYGMIYPEDIGTDERGVFMIKETEFDSEQGGIGMDSKKIYFDDKDIPLLESLNII